MFKRPLFFGFAGMLALAPSVVHAALFASQAVAYVQGTVSAGDAVYDDPQAAVGMPQGITGASAGYPGVVSPFNPAFDTDQIVVIGVGGHLELKFPAPVVVGTGPSVGVFSNVGLTDANYPSGEVNSPAQTFGGGQAKVRVSEDGVTWYNLGLQTFDIPEDYYTNAGPYDTTAPADPAIAHFARPYTGGLDAFNGENYPLILDTLAGSAGGTWFDLSAAGLSEINYIKFTVPANETAGSILAIEAVSVAHGHVAHDEDALDAAVAQSVSAVPVPPAVYTGGVVLVAMMIWRSRRRVFRVFA